jgi:hypothetical protein
MLDRLYDAGDSFMRFMEAQSAGQVVLFSLLSLILPPLATVVHEAGHAIVARRYGVPVRAFVAAPEGPALTLSGKNGFVRIGLGLGRDLRSTEPTGWVRLKLSSMPPEQAIAVLRAGPSAEAGLGGLLLAMALLPQPLPRRVVFGLNGLAALSSAHRNLSDQTHPGSDGFQIRRIRARADLALPEWIPATPEDSHTSTSVAPPGY